MLKQKKKTKPARNPDLYLEFVEDMNNITDIICDCINSPNTVSLSKPNKTLKFSNETQNILPSHRRYNSGSVYRQAIRFLHYKSSSTNISSSVSGSVEVIVSEIDNLNEVSEYINSTLPPVPKTIQEKSEESEEKIIKNLIDQHKRLADSSSYECLENLNTSMKKLIFNQNAIKRTQEIKKLKVRLEVLKALSHDTHGLKHKIRSSY
jgi:hypothetical protein